MIFIFKYLAYTLGIPVYATPGMIFGIFPTISMTGLWLGLFSRKRNFIFVILFFIVHYFFSWIANDYGFLYINQLCIPEGVEVESFAGAESQIEAGLFNENLYNLIIETISFSQVFLFSFLFDLTVGRRLLYSFIFTFGIYYVSKWIFIGIDLLFWGETRLTFIP